jgi:hypothetical protein
MESLNKINFLDDKVSQLEYFNVKKTRVLSKKVK